MEKITTVKLMTVLSVHGVFFLLLLLVIYMLGQLLGKIKLFITFYMKHNWCTSPEDFSFTSYVNIVTSTPVYFISITVELNCSFT